MDHVELLEADDLIEQIDWGTFFDDFPEDLNELEVDAANSLSQDSTTSSRIGEIENILMNDNDGDVAVVAAEASAEIYDRFLADVLADSPVDGAGEVVDCQSDKDSESTRPETPEGEEKKDDPAEVANEDESSDDPTTKKRQRQLRNRDAAVRSRERKKIYVKDLELKSKYLEGECLRMGRLLQCLIAENQALRLSLQNSNAHGASMAKQESAVLLMESLLLGSLFWFLGIMCLSTLPMSLHLVAENVAEKDQVTRALKGARSETMFGSLASFTKTRRCKASKTKMKANFCAVVST